MTIHSITSIRERRVSPAVQQFLDDLDERAGSAELSQDYLESLTREEWRALRSALDRNDVPLRVKAPATRFTDLAA